MREELIKKLSVTLKIPAFISSNAYWHIQIYFVIDKKKGKIIWKIL